jgi:hypothetical protein
MASTAQININVNSGQATKSVNELNNEVVAAAGSATSLKTELRKIVQELQTLEPSSERFRTLSARAGELRDQIADTNAVVGQLAGNFAERLFRGINGTVQIGVAGFQAIQSAIALTGVESEDLQKSLLQMNALLNLSQALETFAGIDQKIVEIKASFQSLIGVQQTQAAVTETQAVAQTAANVATETGVVATTSLTTATSALGVAMKALPIIGLVAAIGSLAYGIYQYATSSKEASKEEENRKKKLEELKKSQQEYVSTLANESGKFVMLITRLKQTNALSDDRKKLIKDINKEFGTTLKNIKDEGKFQEQLNLVVADYIAYQTVKYKLQKNEEKFIKNLEKQEVLQGKIYKMETDVFSVLNQARRAVKEMGQDDLYAGKKIANLRDAEAAYKDLKTQLDNLKKSNEGVANVATQYESTLAELTKQGTRFGDTTKDNTDKTDKQTEALKNLESITNAILGLQGEVITVENEVFKLRSENGDKSIDLAEREKKQRLDAFMKTYTEIKTSIEKEITDQKVKTEKIKLLEEALQNFKRLLGEKELEENTKTNQAIIEAERKKNESLLLEQKTLQTEIQFGDGNTTDTKIGLLNRQLDAQIKVYDTLLKTQKIGEDLSLREYEQLLNDRQALYEQYLSGLRDEQIKEAEAESARQLKLEEERLNADKNYLISVDENGKYRVQLTEKYQKEIEGLSKVEQDNIAANAVLTEENLNQVKINLAEDLAVKKEEIDAEYYENYKTSTEQTEQEVFDNKIKLLDDYLAYAEQAFNNVSQLISEFSQQNLDIALTQLDDTTKLQQEQLDSQLAAQLITREEYDNKVEQLNQQQQQKELQLKRKNFRTEKTLNLVGATIDGARAVLSAFANTTGGIVVKSIAAALAGVFAATQIALIARQEFRAATGGIVPGNGSGEIDSVPARLAPGEAVINSRSSEMFLPLLSAINEMGGGKSFMPDLPAVNSGQKFEPVFSSPNQQTIVKAYVVESELSQVQKRINRIERSISF